MKGTRRVRCDHCHQLFYMNQTFNWTSFRVHLTRSIEVRRVCSPACAILETREICQQEGIPPCGPIDRPLTQREKNRRHVAERCDRNDIDSVKDAVRGLQSTDHPSLLPLHDELMKVLHKLEDAAKEKK